MRFKTFLEDYDKMLAEIESILEATDTVEWDPTAGEEYAGTGITRTLPQLDPARTQKIPTLPNMNQKPKPGDVAFLRGPGGQFVPTVIISLEGNNVQVANKGRTIRSVRPMNDFKPAPAAVMKQFPGRTGWLVTSSPASVL